MPNRRAVILALCSSAASGGCLGQDFGSGTATSDPLESRLSIQASVVAQPSSEQPLGLRFVVANEGSSELLLSSDDKVPFEVLERLSGTDGDVVLVPEDTREGEVMVDVADQRTDGCWRYVRPDGSDPTYDIQMDEDTMTLAPGSSHAVVHDAYFDGDNDRCFPAGEYTTEHDISEVNDSSERVATMTVTPVLTMAADGTATLTVER